MLEAAAGAGPMAIVERRPPEGSVTVRFNAMITRAGRTKAGITTDRRTATVMATKTTTTPATIIRATITRTTITATRRP